MRTNKNISHPISLIPAVAVWVICLLLSWGGVCHAQTPAPIGLWHFDETSGGTAADSSTSARTITLSGGYTHTAGHLNEAITFDGSTGYGATSTWGQLTGQANRSISVWFNTTSTANASFVCWGGTANLDLNKIGIESKSIGFFGDLSDTSHSCAVTTSTSTYCNGQWHNLTVTTIWSCILPNGPC